MIINGSCKHPNRDTCTWGSFPSTSLGPCGACDYYAPGSKPQVIVTKEDISKDTTIEIIDNEAYQARACISCGKSRNPQFYSGYLDKFKDGERTSVRESVAICCDCFVKLTGKEVR